MLDGDLVRNDALEEERDKFLSQFLSSQTWQIMRLDAITHIETSRIKLGDIEHEV